MIAEGAVTMIAVANKQVTRLNTTQSLQRQHRINVNAHVDDKVILQRLSRGD